MHNWDREQQDNKFRQKLNNVKSTLPKINHPNTTTNSSSKHKTTAASLPFTKNLRKQNNLKYILREFGLSQYIRKLFNLGYDDSNSIQSEDFYAQQSKHFNTSLHNEKTESDEANNTIVNEIIKSNPTKGEEMIQLIESILSHSNKKKKC